MSDSVTADLVRHIANLGRLKLDEAEVSVFTSELSAILEYISQLEGIDVEGIEPTAHAVEVRNVFRDDDAQPSLPSDAVLANAPAREGVFFKVPKVLDQDTV